MSRGGSKYFCMLRRSTHKFYSTHLAMQKMPDRGFARTSFVFATIRHHLHSKVGGVKCVRTTTQHAEYFESAFRNIFLRIRSEEFDIRLATGRPVGRSLWIVGHAWTNAEGRQFYPWPILFFCLIFHFICLHKRFFLPVFNPAKLDRLCY
jgi:hypothetical protein